MSSCTHHGRQGHRGGEQGATAARSEFAVRPNKSVGAQTLVSISHASDSTRTLLKWAIHHPCVPQTGQRHIASQPHIGRQRGDGAILRSGAARGCSRRCFHISGLRAHYNGSSSLVVLRTRNVQQAAAAACHLSGEFFYGRSASQSAATAVSMPLSVILSQAKRRPPPHRRPRAWGVTHTHMGWGASL